MRVVVSNSYGQGFVMEAFYQDDGSALAGKVRTKDLGGNIVQLDADVSGALPVTSVRAYVFDGYFRTTMLSMYYYDSAKKPLVSMTKMNFSLSRSLDDFYADPLVLFDGGDSIHGTRFADTLRGYKGHDSLFGSGGNDRLFGGAGNDRLSGQKGHDKVRGDDGADVLSGGGGRDSLFGGQQNDRLKGDDGRDTLLGNQGNDSLIGGRDADTLNGGRGRDVLEGGSGADRFVFRRGDGRDVIRDFTPGVDKIAIGYGANTMSDLKFGQQGQDVVLRFADVTIRVEDVVLADLNSAGNFEL